MWWVHWFCMVPMWMELVAFWRHTVSAVIEVVLYHQWSKSATKFSNSSKFKAPPNTHTVIVLWGWAVDDSWEKFWIWGVGFIAVQFEGLFVHCVLDHCSSKSLWNTYTVQKPKEERHPVFVLWIVGQVVPRLRTELVLVWRLGWSRIIVTVHCVETEMCSRFVSCSV